MVGAIVLHGERLDIVCELGAMVGEALGLAVEQLAVADGRAADRLRAESGKVWCVASELMLDRELRVDCLRSKVVVRVCEGERADSGAMLGGVGLAGGRGSARIWALVERELNEAHGVVNPRLGGIEASVREVVALATRAPVVVAADERTYLVEVGRGVVEKVVRERAFGAAVSLYMSDENVDRLHGERMRRAVAASGVRLVPVVLPAGEESKCLRTLGDVFDLALASGVDRSSWVIAVGGGVVTDISGLVAALWMRGLRWIGIPTTLLSMVDASVGGKTAVDHGMGKNAVGAFWQPSLVVCDVEFLRTETERNYIGALSEVVKTAVIGDPELFELLERQSSAIRQRDLDLMTDIVRRCVKVKAHVVGLDERESGLRAVLNFGHTVGHALEALGEYRRYTHGEAVSLGMVAALRLGERLGHTPPELSARVERLLVELGLPVALGAAELEGASELLGHDKKRAGSGLKFVFAEGLGCVRPKSVMLEDLRELVVSLADG